MLHYDFSELLKQGNWQEIYHWLTDLQQRNELNQPLANGLALILMVRDKRISYSEEEATYSKIIQILLPYLSSYGAIVLVTEIKDNATLFQSVFTNIISYPAKYALFNTLLPLKIYPDPKKSNYYEINASLLEIALHDKDSQRLSLLLTAASDMLGSLSDIKTKITHTYEVTPLYSHSFLGGAVPPMGGGLASSYPTFHESSSEVFFEKSTYSGTLLGRTKFYEQMRTVSQKNILALIFTLGRFDLLPELIIQEKMILDFFNNHYFYGFAPVLVHQFYTWPPSKQKVFLQALTKKDPLLNNPSQVLNICHMIHTCFLESNHLFPREFSALTFRRLLTLSLQPERPDFLYQLEEILMHTAARYDSLSYKVTGRKIENKSKNTLEILEKLAKQPGVFPEFPAKENPFIFLYFFVLDDLSSPMSYYKKDSLKDWFEKFHASIAATNLDNAAFLTQGGLPSENIDKKIREKIQYLGSSYELKNLQKLASDCLKALKEDYRLWEDYFTFIQNRQTLSFHYRFQDEGELLERLSSHPKISLHNQISWVSETANFTLFLVTRLKSESHEVRFFNDLAPQLQDTFITLFAEKLLQSPSLLEEFTKESELQALWITLLENTKNIDSKKKIVELFLPSLGSNESLLNKVLACFNTDELNQLFLFTSKCQYIPPPTIPSPHVSAIVETIVQSVYWLEATLLDILLFNGNPRVLGDVLSKLSTHLSSIAFPSRSITEIRKISHEDKDTLLEELKGSAQELSLEKRTLFFYLQGVPLEKAVVLLNHFPSFIADNTDYILEQFYTATPIQRVRLLTLLSELLPPYPAAHPTMLLREALFIYLIPVMLNITEQHLENIEQTLPLIKEIFTLVLQPQKSNYAESMENILVQSCHPKTGLLALTKKTPWHSPALVAFSHSLSQIGNISPIQNPYAKLYIYIATELEYAPSEPLQYWFGVLHQALLTKDKEKIHHILQVHPDNKIRNASWFMSLWEKSPLALHVEKCYHSLAKENGDDIQGYFDFLKERKTLQFTSSFEKTLLRSLFSSRENGIVTLSPSGNTFDSGESRLQEASQGVIELRERPKPRQSNKQGGM